MEFVTLYYCLQFLRRQPWKEHGEARLTGGNDRVEKVGLRRTSKPKSEISGEGPQARVREDFEAASFCWTRHFRTAYSAGLSKKTSETTT